MKQLVGNIVENGIAFVVIIIGIMMIAYGLEKWGQNRNGEKGKILTPRKIAVIGLFSAIAAILHIVDFPVPFAPSFYKLDGSEIPVLLCTFAMGPVSGVMVEVCKILLKLIIKGTSTAFVGDLANFVVGCSFILPASFMYLWKRTKLHAILGCLAGTLMMTVLGTAFNALYLIPAFSVLYGIPLEEIIKMGTAVNSHIHDVTSFVIWAVAPLNLLKGFAVSIITIACYKPLSPHIKHLF